MDYETARQVLIRQGKPPVSDTDALLIRLRQGQSPIPGQVTTLLLALKVAFEALKDSDVLERNLVDALHTLASESQQLYEVGQQQGIDWPPLLKEDLMRIQWAVKSIFAASWLEADKRAGESASL